MRCLLPPLSCRLHMEVIVSRAGGQVHCCPRQETCALFCCSHTLGLGPEPSTAEDEGPRSVPSHLQKLKSLPGLRPRKKHIWTHLPPCICPRLSMKRTTKCTHVYLLPTHLHVLEHFKGAPRPTGPQNPIIKAENTHIRQWEQLP